MMVSGEPITWTVDRIVKHFESQQAQGRAQSLDCLDLLAIGLVGILKFWPIFALTVLAMIHSLTH